MLPLKHRLKKRKDFERAHKEGKGFKQDFLFLKVIENKLENTRIGIVVSTKIAKKATERNLIKRRIREIMRKRLEEIKPGLDIVIITLKGINKETSFKEIEEVIDKLLLKIEIKQ
ncbi:MAG: ribonuclease P protein component [Patescibacteria group bacterium]|nr:ribonuclease P protein component [Patescibacteria group bacterium]